MTRAQQIRRKERDRKKKWDMIVSSIQSMSEWDVLEAVGDKMIREVVQIAQEQGLTIIAIIGLEALKVRDREVHIKKLDKYNDELLETIEKLQADLKRAQETITKMNLRYLRRKSVKAKVQHPEKRRGR